MAGQAQNIIDRIIAQKSYGNPVIASSIRTKLVLKGINLKTCAQGIDDPGVIATLRSVAVELNVVIENAK